MKDVFYQKLTKEIYKINAFIIQENLFENSERSLEFNRLIGILTGLTESRRWYRLNYRKNLTKTKQTL